MPQTEQLTFANRLGEMELLPPEPAQKTVAISNRKLDRTILAPNEHRFKSLRGNDEWHTDSSYMPWRQRRPCSPRN